MKESKTLENYVLNETPQTVTLTQDQITDLTFENELIKGYIRVMKVSKEDNQYNGDVKGTRLENAKFEVYDENNQHLGEVIHILEMPTQDILEIEEPNGKTFMIPYVDAFIVDEDYDNNRLVIRLIEGIR